MIPTIMERISGTIQLLCLGGVAFTSSKTSEGATKTFVRRVMSGLDCGGASCDVSGGCSSIVLVYTLVRQMSNIQQRNLPINWPQIGEIPGTCQGMLHPCAGSSPRS